MAARRWTLGLNGVVLEDSMEAHEGESIEFAHLVKEATVAFVEDLLDGALEARIVFVPVVDGGAVDGGGIGRGSDRAAMGEGDGSSRLGWGERPE